MKIRKNMFIIVLAAIVFTLISSWHVFAQFESDDLSTEEQKRSEEQGPPDWAPAHGRRDKDKGDKGKGKAWGKKRVDFIKLYNKSGLPVTIVASNKEGEKEIKLAPAAGEYKDETISGGLGAGSQLIVKIGDFEKKFNVIPLIKKGNIKEEITLKTPDAKGGKKRNLEIAYQPDQKAIVVVVSPEGKFESYK